ncbi:hypothetical protein EDC56_1492 [Sinobacterium caligoides]|uniref:Uncharacterized protein n=1 Tax=Sinobacterium caligoides TaxID=933926 RepID=A0A3N2DMP6_9GAMM|nr:hypothetical protein EDC56_1492 [Sinobacterium caligoides]
MAITAALFVKALFLKKILLKRLFVKSVAKNVGKKFFLKSFVKGRWGITLPDTL